MKWNFKNVTSKKDLSEIKKLLPSGVTIEEEEQARFKSLPKEVQFQALEYYGYMKALKNGDKLSRENLIKCSKLCSVIDDYKITPISFEVDIFK